uniref:Uncharacterized protein n=1 Tax=Lotus japonicus TaxID=34305 RepID=I3T6Z3_LOTJA|nr:unknown [Lotus japonicus]
MLTRYKHTSLSSSPKPGYPVLKLIQRNHGPSLPVLMPGDEVPRFIALACPCQPPTEERTIVHVQKDGFCSGN